MVYLAVIVTSATIARHINPWRRDRYQQTPYRRNR